MPRRMRYGKTTRKEEGKTYFQGEKTLMRGATIQNMYRAIGKFPRFISSSWYEYAHSGSPGISKNIPIININVMMKWKVAIHRFTFLGVLFKMKVAIRRLMTNESVVLSKMIGSIYLWAKMDGNESKAIKVQINLTKSPTKQTMNMKQETMKMKLDIPHVIHLF